MISVRLALLLARFRLVAISTTACLVLSGCSSEDANAIKATASVLRTSADEAFSRYVDLQIRSQLEPNSSGTSTRRYYQREKLLIEKGDTRNADVMRRIDDDLRQPAAADRIRRVYENEFTQIIATLRSMEAIAQKYAETWPLGTTDIVCLKTPLKTIGAGFRKAALSMNSPSAANERGERYQQFHFELDQAHQQLAAAVKAKNDADGMAAVAQIKEVLSQEAAENAKVQGLFVKLAEATAEFYEAVDRAGKVSALDALNILASLVPKLSKLDTSLDTQTPTAALRGVIGKINGETWLKQFAADTGYAIPPQCGLVQ